MVQIQKTRVADEGLTKLIQRLGRDCLPTQFVREFVMNGIEAIQRIGKNGKIIVDVDWRIFSAHNKYKISFIDNGEGMYVDQMIQHLNNLSSSGSENNIYENYGMGAKIAALTRNHAGIFYDSWRDGQGNQIVIGFDPISKVYGIKPFENVDGSIAWSSALAPEQKHEIIADHGTRVTLFGNSDDEDTMLPPPGVKGGRENWLYQYLNTRFFVVPEAVDILVRIGYYREKDNTRHNYLRIVKGQKATLDNASEAKGFVQCSDAKILWWILSGDAAGHGREYVTGHTACVHQNEIFDIADGRSNRATNFGIVLGKEEVVLYVEPDSGVLQDTTRTRLIQSDGTPLPWDRWQDEFRSQFPDKLKEFVARKLASTKEENVSDSIKKRISEVKAFFKLSRYRKDETGDERTLEESETNASVGMGNKTTVGNGSARNPAIGSSVGSLAELLRSKTDPQGQASKLVNPDNLPTISWITRANDTRGHDELEDRAAEFNAKYNIIKINQDFQGFHDVFNYYMKKYGEIPGSESVIWNQIKEIFGQIITEAVLGAQQFQKRPRWDLNDADAAISPETLTTVAMTRYHAIKHIDSILRKKLPELALQPPTAESEV